MNIFALAALLFAVINAASIPVMKPSYRRLTPEMLAKRMEKLNQKPKAMLKLKLILSRKHLI